MATLQAKGHNYYHACQIEYPFITYAPQIDVFYCVSRSLFEVAKAITKCINNSGASERYVSQTWNVINMPGFQHAMQALRTIEYPTAKSYGISLCNE